MPVTLQRIMLIFLMLGGGRLMAQTWIPAVNFEGGWESAFQKAKRFNRPVFVDFVQDGCMPCKKLDAKTLSEPEVGKFYNDHFINLKLDVRSPEGKPFGDKAGVKATPTLAFFSPDGDVLFAHEGFLDVQDIIDLGMRVDEFWRSKQDTPILTEEEALIDGLRRKAEAAILERDEEEYKLALKEIKRVGVPAARALSLRVQAQWAGVEHKWKKNFKFSDKYLRKYGQEDAHYLFEAAQNAHRYLRKRKYLQQACDWVQHACEVERSYERLHLYALLLYRLGELETALKAAEAAIVIGRAERKEYSETEDLLQRMILQRDSESPSEEPPSEAPSTPIDQ